MSPASHHLAIEDCAFHFPGTLQPLMIFRDARSGLRSLVAHRPWARARPLETLSSFQRLLIKTTTWGICSSIKQRLQAPKRRGVLSQFRYSCGRSSRATRCNRACVRLLRQRSYHGNWRPLKALTNKQVTTLILEARQKYGPGFSRPIGCLAKKPLRCDPADAGRPVPKRSPGAAAASKHQTVKTAFVGAEVAALADVFGSKAYRVSVHRGPAVVAPAWTAAEEVGILGE